MDSPQGITVASDTALASISGRAIHDSYPLVALKDLNGVVAACKVQACAVFQTAESFALG